jgi:hypothetical protein
MVRYQHRQWAVAILASLTIAGLGCLTGGMLAPPEARWVLLLVPLFLALAVLFSSLTVEVTKESLRWWFGLGFWRKRVALADIEKVEVTETRFIEGWGIHLTGRGWLYNVSGFGAVLVTQKDGKRFMLGSDEPDMLAEALNAALR